MQAPSRADSEEALQSLMLPEMVQVGGHGNKDRVDARKQRSQNKRCLRGNLVDAHVGRRTKTPINRRSIERSRPLRIDASAVGAENDSSCRAVRRLY